MTRKERLELARIQLANVVNTLMTNTDPCGPFMLDLECAETLLSVARKLGAEENAQVQLDKVDEELGWHGSGKGRMDYIKRCKGTS